MRIVIFGLTVSSSWSNGHATLWRSLIQALDDDGHEVVFYERDDPSFRAHRDRPELGGKAQLRFYDTWGEVRAEACATIDEADVAIVSSYCPDGRGASDLVLDAPTVTRVFYELDTPVTLARLAGGEDVAYLPARGLGEFDLVLSSTGGRALDMLREKLGVRRVAPLYGSVDPVQHRPVPAEDTWAAACSYLGTWSDDRHAVLDELFLEAARRRPDERFIIGGSQYPPHVEWPSNVVRHEHVPPPQHPAFYCSSRLTVSVTRAPESQLGYCPSARLFEAAACGVPVLSDAWEGLETFFTPQQEILIAKTTADVEAALAMPHEELARIGARARERTLDEHSAARRAAELVGHLEGAAR